MNWPKLILITILVAGFLLLFGTIISDTLAAIDYSELDDGITVMATIIGAFISAIDTATVTFPLTITTILVIGGLGGASYTVRKILKL